MLTAAVERAHPVVPLELVMVRSNPPSKKPHVTLAALSRSPMFLPDMLKFLLVEEQMSPAGSASLMSVNPPLPSATTAVPGLTALITPFVCPEIRLRAPGVDGPKVVLNEWSLIA